MVCQKRYTYRTIINAEGERNKSGDRIGACRKEQAGIFHVAPYLCSEWSESC